MIIITILSIGVNIFFVYVMSNMEREFLTNRSTLLLELQKYKEVIYKLKQEIQKVKADNIDCDGV